MADENIDGDFIQARGSLRAKKLRQEADEYAKEIERRQPPAQVDPQTTQVPGQEGASLGFAIAGDLMKGVMETPRAILGGARDAVQETLESMDGLALWLNENVADLSVMDPATAPKLNLPDVEDPESTTGNVVKSASQFLTGFIPALRGMRAISGGKAATRMGQFAQGEAAAAVSSALVFDPHEARLSNLIQEVPALENPVTEYLAASPDDADAEGRLKSALEGLALAPVAEGMLWGLRSIRANRIEKGVDPARPLGTPDEAIIKDLGDLDEDAFFVGKDEPSAPSFSTKVTDEQGQPLTVWHGSPTKGFTEFDPTKINKNDPDAPVVGFWFSESQEQAAQHGKFPFGRPNAPDAEVRPFHLKLENPASRKDVREVTEALRSRGEETTTTSITEELKRRGFDGYQHEKALRLTEEQKRTLETTGRVDLDSNRSLEKEGDFINLNDKRAGGFVADYESVAKLEAAHPGTWAVFDPKNIVAPESIAKAKPQLASEEAAKAFLESGQLPFDLEFKMNWAKFSSSEQATEVLNDVAQLFAGQIDEARRGVIQDVELRKLAASIGMQPEQLLARQAGGVFNAEQIMASKMILDSASQQVLALARKARNSVNDADQFAFRRMLDIHAGLQKQMQGAASEAGRAFRALRVPTGSTESQINQIREALMKDGGPDKLRSMAEALSEINDPDVINKAIRESFGKRATDAVVEWWYFALLSGPQTHAVNMTSNALNTVWQIPERFLAEKAGKLMGDPGVVEGEARELLYGLVTSLPDAIRLAGRAFVTGEPSDIFGKVEARTQEAITAENFPIGKDLGRVFGEGVGKTIDAAVDGFGTFVRIPTRTLMAEDEFFRTIGKSMQSRTIALRQVTREGLTGKDAAKRIQDLIRNPDQTMLEAGQTFARELTFTTPLGTGGRAIQMAVNKHPWAKAALPFIRTPANLFKWAGKRTPLGLLSGNIRREIVKGGPEGDLALARIGMGSLVALSFADLAFNGNVTGYGPTNKDERRVWLETNQPWSVKVGDTFYSYNRGDPFGMLIGSAASYAEIAAGMTDEDAEDLATAIAVATAQSVTNKTWLRGVSQTLDALTQPDRYAAKWAREQAATFLIPTGAAQAARVKDPVWRDVQSLADAIKARIPGFSDEVPPMRNLFGHAIPLEGGLGPDIVSPIYTKSDKESPIADWMLANRVLPDRPGRTRAGVEMTPKQYDRYAELAGHGTKDPLTGMGLEETLNALVQGTHPRSYVWEQMTDGPKGGRSTIVRTLIQTFRDLAWSQLLEEDDELRSRVIATRHEDADAMQRPIMRPSAGAAP